MATKIYLSQRTTRHVVKRLDASYIYELHFGTWGTPQVNTTGFNFPWCMAADPSDIMVHVFNAPHATGQYAVNRIQKILTSDAAADVRIRELRKLHAQISPGYWSYRIRRALKSPELLA